MVHHITVATSVEAGADAFFDFGPDTTLVVDANAFLLSELQSGAHLKGAWTVTINGEVGSFDTVGDAGLHISPLINAAELSTVKIGKTGDVFGALFGIVADASLDLTNLGTISGVVNSIATTGGTAHITNAGTIIGIVFLGGDAADVFTDFKKIGKVIKSGSVDGIIALGGGDDHFNGGSHAETVLDGDGADTIKLGGGNDTYSAVFNFLGDGIDVIDGGKGAADLYDASSVTSVDLIINLDTVAHIDALTGAPNTAAVKDSSFFYPPETITGFENASGGAGDDSIFGTKATNVLKGNEGVDDLFGFGGRDILSGGLGADTFIFLSLSDSTVARSGRDVITDFDTLRDKIDLAGIDAIKGGGDDAFHLTGNNGFDGFTRHPGELGFKFTSGGDTIVSGDVNGDGKADFSILLKGDILLHDTNFVL
jgi:Ca2+-binding RTX toxin-like protein